MYITICEIDDQSKFNAWKKNKTKQNKKIRTTKGTFNVMMGTIKDRNVMDRKEAAEGHQHVLIAAKDHRGCQSDCHPWSGQEPVVLRREL